ncbi:MAG: hypothetical protein ACI9O4_000140, partial [Chitinophagales bacterium]
AFYFKKRIVEKRFNYFFRALLIVKPPMSLKLHSLHLLWPLAVNS